MTASFFWGGGGPSFSGLVVGVGDACDVLSSCAGFIMNTSHTSTHRINV